MQTNGVEAPEIGRWYRCPDGSLFEVVAVDQMDGTIEMQHFDGTLEEYDPDEWLNLRAEGAQPPEDWSGSVDINEEDRPDSDHPLLMDWQHQVDYIDDLEIDLD